MQTQITLKAYQKELVSFVNSMGLGYFSQHMDLLKLLKCNDTIIQVRIFVSSKRNLTTPLISTADQ